VIFLFASITQKAKIFFSLFIGLYGGLRIQPITVLMHTG